MSGVNQESLPINTHSCQNGQTDLTVETSSPSTIAPLTTISCDQSTISTFNTNGTVLRGANQSLSANKNQRPDRYLFSKNSNSSVVDNQHDRLSNNRLSLTQKSIEYNDDPVSM